MPEPQPSELPQLQPRVLQFAQLLRAAGLPVGTDRIVVALQALAQMGWASPQQLRTVLGACLMSRQEHQPLFDRAFDLYWVGGAVAMDLRARGRGDVSGSAAKQAARDESMHAQASALERLAHQDFATMDEAQWRRALEEMRREPFVPELRPTRRRARAPRPGRVDLRASLREAARRGGESLRLKYTQARVQPARVVMLADVSRSMTAYAQAFLHLGHHLGRPAGRRRAAVECFTFGTRLTRVTTWMRLRDPQQALARAVSAVPDWCGGTRIAASLAEFNRRWARRVLDSRCTVLLLTDGLEQGPPGELAFETQRLRKSCRRLLWGNPLLRFSGFEPKAAGVRAMRPHVHALMPAHNLASLRQMLRLPGARSGARPPVLLRTATETPARPALPLKNC